MDWRILFTEWADFLIRWVHVITGICWIGSSFYFVHLDLSLQKRDGLPQGVGGEAWQVHGGGFYNMMKYTVAPSHLPQDLTWFKWEAYWTFISGFTLLCWHYFAHADLYLIDRTVMDLAPWQAVSISLVVLVMGWVIYDFLCRSKLGDNDLALGVVGFLFLVAIAFGLTRVFSGRGAFILLGALIGTIMVANVAMNIMPNQKKTIAALIAGEPPNPAYGKTAKSRSLHNNYLTLPVIFLMVSNHYPLAFGSQWNWLIVTLVMVIGGVVRHFFNSEHARKGSPWWTWAVAAACFIAIILLSGVSRDGGNAALTPAPAAKVKFAQVEEIVTSRCSMCHMSEPVWDGVNVPPKGVMLDTPERIRLHADQIYVQAVMTRAMPPGGNLTDLSEDDRKVLAAWVQGGALAD